MLTSPTLAALPTIAREESEGEANPARSEAQIVCPEWDRKEVRFPPPNISLPSPSKAGTSERGPVQLPWEYHAISLQL